MVLEASAAEAGVVCAPAEASAVTAAADAGAEAQAVSASAEETASDAVTAGDVTAQSAVSCEETTVPVVDMAVILNDPELFRQYCEQLTLQVEELQRQQEEAADQQAAAREELSNQTRSKTWKGSVLNKTKGIVKGPNGRETYYNLNMNKIVAVLKKAGYEGDYWVRKDGVKMYGDYIMVAANYSKYHYGSIVETSLGTGIVCDTGDFAKYSRVSLDIATTW